MWMYITSNFFNLRAINLDYWLNKHSPSSQISVSIFVASFYQMIDEGNMENISNLIAICQNCFKNPATCLISYYYCYCLVCKEEGGYTTQSEVPLPDPATIKMWPANNQMHRHSLEDSLPKKHHCRLLLDSLFEQAEDAMVHLCLAMKEHNWFET